MADTDAIPPADANAAPPPAVPPPAFDAQQLANAQNNLATTLAALTTVLTNMHQQPPPAVPADPVPHQNVLHVDPLASTQAINLNSRAGLEAYKRMSSALPVKWDGTTTSFPDFLVVLTSRSQEARWNSPGASGILTINGLQLLTDYSNISEAELETARTARTDARALQNSKAMFLCLVSSMHGNLLVYLQTQMQSALIQEDGPTLLKHMLTFSPVSNLNTKTLSSKQVMDFDPSSYKFDIVSINKSLLHLFVLCGTRFTLDEQIFYTTSTYLKIKRPEAWGTWARGIETAYEAGSITNLQSLMNSAVFQQTRLMSRDDRNWSLRSNDEDVVAMVSLLNKTVTGMTKGKRKSAPVRKPKSGKDDKEAEPRKGLPNHFPPFAQATCSPASEGSTPYKIGDTQIWKTKTYHFCDTPNHKFESHWHQFPATDCRTRKKWLNDPTSSHTANVADVPDDVESPSDDASAASPSDSSIESHLSTALNLAQDDAVRDMLADTLAMVGEFYDTGA